MFNSKEIISMSFGKTQDDSCLEGIELLTYTSNPPEESETSDLYGFL